MQRLFMVLWVSISAMLCMRAVLTLWHAFMFLGLRFFLLFAWWPVLFSCKKLSDYTAQLSAGFGSVDLVTWG
jgi:membrane protein implicated in regulation of membrane protease activity